MLSKESKIRVLENFYALDYALFGKPVVKLESCCPALAEDYINVKGALLSVMIEMYTLVGHTPKEITEKLTTKNIMKMARESASLARANSKKLVVSEQGRSDIKHSLREALNDFPTNDVDDLVQEKIREKAFSLAVDNLLVARTLTEASEVTKLNEWEGSVIEDAYKILRDSLVDSAALIVTTVD